LKSFFTFPESTWWWSAVFFMVVIVRAVATDRAWWKAPDAFEKLKRGIGGYGK
jgi:hypothetical protein